MNSNKNLYAKLIPVMLCFFAMGFVDLVGIASNYVKRGSGSDRLSSQYISFLGLLLVPDFLRTYRYSDE